MVRRLCLLAALVLLACLPARAQFFTGDKIELSAGYSFLRFRSTPQANLSGFEFSGQYKIFPWLGAVADVSKDWGSIGGVGSSVSSYLGGVQATWPGKLPWNIAPFVHAMGGRSEFSGGGFTSGTWTLDGGAGVDKHLNRLFTWRILQGDYVRTRFESDTQGNLRFSTSILIHF